jgi:hypothetical protein
LREASRNNLLILPRLPNDHGRIVYHFGYGESSKLHPDLSVVHGVSNHMTINLNEMRWSGDCRNVPRPMAQAGGNWIGEGQHHGGARATVLTNRDSAQSFSLDQV